MLHDEVNWSKALSRKGSEELRPLPLTLSSVRLMRVSIVSFSAASARLNSEGLRPATPSSCGISEMKAPWPGL